MAIWQFVLPIGLVLLTQARRDCVRQQTADYDMKFVCVCNASYCDDIEPLGELSPGQVAVYLTSKGGARLARQDGKFNEPSEDDKNGAWAPGKGGLLPKKVGIVVNASIRYQTIMGFGGAFTDAAGINLNSLSPATRDSLLRQYYGETGIEYVLGRVPIASCDFSTRQYSYVDKEDDFNLTSFQLAPEDYHMKIPYIIKAINLTKDELKLFASPWSPPAWFKTTNKMAGGGTLKGEINGPYYESYAKYFDRFFTEYAKNGVLFWGLTTQNEPTTGLIPKFTWQTMWLSPYAHQQFIKNFLGPYLRKNKVTSKIKIMVNDDNVYALSLYADKILNDAETAAFIDGVGVHWYFSDFFGRDHLISFQQAHSDKFILSTEACNGFEPFVHAINLGSFERGDRYARDIINVLQRFSVGWTDWNLCLDLNGGPNWAKNFVDAPIIVNASADVFYKQPMFYVLGQFSKFIKPGSVRIDSKIDPLPYGNRLSTIAFVTPSSQRVLVVLNSHYENSYNISLRESKQHGTFDYHIAPMSIATFIWNK